MSISSKEINSGNFERTGCHTPLPWMGAVWAFFFGVAASWCEESQAAERQESVEVSFRQDVVPALTRAGCNSGTCHGTPHGKNGFRLSLRGYDLELDRRTLTREISGRRINLVDPGESLLLLKATGQVVHEGGRRFDAESDLYRLLHDWIAQGARDDSETAPRLERLEMSPSEVVLETPAESQSTETTDEDRREPNHNGEAEGGFQQMQVTASYSDGSSRDITHLARFSVNDESVADVTQEGLVRKLKRGEVTVSAEYMNDFATSQITFLEPVPEFVWHDPPEHNFVDRHVFAKLKQLRIEPAGLSTDEEFVRRVFLDAIGRLPSPDEVREFLADPGSDKRSQLIDSLLEGPEFADWWALKWADRLGSNQRFVGKIGAIKYHRWIRHAMAANVPEDRFVRQILTGQGGNYSNPPAGFYRRVRDPESRAEEVAQLFLGVRMQCARCHNHPGERWTQDDYHGLAAFFARVNYKDGPFFVHQYDKEETVYVPREGELTHPRNGQVVVPRFLGGPQADVSDATDRREILARWLTAPDNPFFARMSANRIWYHLFGRGIVEPVDDFRSSNPPSNQPLLEALAEDFVQHGFDRKHLIRTILNSRVYQLGSQTTATNEEDERYFSRYPVRLLGAEQLLDAICAATGVDEPFAGFPPETPAVALPDGEYKHTFLEAFGRPARAMACECEREEDTNLVQALHLVGGEIVHQKVRSDEGRVARLAASEKSEAEIIDELFLATLSRSPAEEERQILLKRFQEGTERRRAAEDILWALINHREFLFQH